MSSEKYYQIVPLLCVQSYDYSSKMWNFKYFELRALCKILSEECVDPTECKLHHFFVVTWVCRIGETVSSVIGKQFKRNPGGREQVTHAIVIGGG